MIFLKHLAKELNKNTTVLKELCLDYNIEVRKGHYEAEPTPSNFISDEDLPKLIECLELGKKTRPILLKNAKLTPEQLEKWENCIIANVDKVLAENPNYTRSMGSTAKEWVNNGEVFTTIGKTKISMKL